MARLGQVWFGRHGEVGSGMARHGAVLFGMVRLGMTGMVWYGKVRSG